MKIENMTDQEIQDVLAAAGQARGVETQGMGYGVIVGFSNRESAERFRNLLGAAPFFTKFHSHIVPFNKALILACQEAGEHGE